MGEISIPRLAVVAALALIVLGIWLFRETGDPDPVHEETARAPHKPRTRYAELCAARREVERRMDDLRFSPGYRGGVSGFRDETMQQLTAIHAEIEAQLEALKTKG
jgi:hypothetical protein